MNDNQVEADRAALATYACMRLALLNVQLVLTSNLPIQFYVNMKNEEEFKTYNGLLKMMNELEIIDISVLVPFIT